MNEDSDKRIAELEQVVRELVEMLAQFAGYHDDDGVYIIDPQRNAEVDDEELRSRFRTFGVRLAPLIGKPK